MADSADMTRTIKVKPDDIYVIEYQGPLPPFEVSNIKKEISEATGCDVMQVVVLTYGMKLRVLAKEDG